MQLNEASGTALHMDAVAEGGTVLRITVHRTDAGHVELGSTLRIAEQRKDGMYPLTTYTVGSFLSAADDRGRLTLPRIGRSDLVIEHHWTTVTGDWLMMLSESLTGR